MLASIKEYFADRLGSNQEADPEKRSSEITIATAALMIEIGLADSHIQKEERQTIEKAIQHTFDLDEEDALQLISIAENEVDNAVSLYEFTRLLNEQLSREERIRIVEMLWRVAFVDSVIDKYEEYYIRKIADLLYVSHKDYIRAKHRVSEQVA
ncbi:MAG: TerB family tellurite resistance protein [Gammaproteobacteria bacterium]